MRRAAADSLLLFSYSTNLSCLLLLTQPPPLFLPFPLPFPSHHCTTMPTFGCLPAASSPAPSFSCMPCYLPLPSSTLPPSPPHPTFLPWPTLLPMPASPTFSLLPSCSAAILRWCRFCVCGTLWVLPSYLPPCLPPPLLGRREDRTGQATNRQAWV